MPTRSFQLTTYRGGDPFPMSSHCCTNVAHMTRISTSGSERKTVRYPLHTSSQPLLLVLRIACLPPWLLFSGMVSLLTLSFLLTGSTPNRGRASAQFSWACSRSVYTPSVTRTIQLPACEKLSATQRPITSFREYRGVGTSP